MRLSVEMCCDLFARPAPPYTGSTAISAILHREHFQPKHSCMPCFSLLRQINGLLIVFQIILGMASPYTFVEVMLPANRKGAWPYVSCRLIHKNHLTVEVSS